MLRGLRAEATSRKGEYARDGSRGGTKCAELLGAPASWRCSPPTRCLVQDRGGRASGEIRGDPTEGAFVVASCLSQFIRPIVRFWSSHQIWGIPFHHPDVQNRITTLAECTQILLALYCEILWK